MAERAQQNYWMMRILYLVICTVMVFLYLLPLDTVPKGWAGPDLVLAITCAWVLRRPRYVPAFVVALVFLLTDFLFQRPPGLWAALVLLGTEALRNRANTPRELPFLAEWFAVSVTLAVITVSYRTVLAVLLIEQAALGLSLIQMLMTLAVYPVVVFLSQTLLGVRKLAPGDLDTMGNRL